MGKKGLTILFAVAFAVRNMDAIRRSICNSQHLHRHTIICLAKQHNLALLNLKQVDIGFVQNTKQRRLGRNDIIHSSNRVTSARFIGPIIAFAPTRLSYGCCYNAIAITTLLHSYCYNGNDVMLMFML